MFSLRKMKTGLQFDETLQKDVQQLVKALQKDVKEKQAEKRRQYKLQTLLNYKLAFVVSLLLWQALQFFSDKQSTLSSCYWKHWKYGINFVPYYQSIACYATGYLFRYLVA